MSNAAPIKVDETHFAHVADSAIVAVRLPQGDYAICRLDKSQYLLLPVSGHEGTFGTNEVGRRFEALRNDGETWIYQPPMPRRLIESPHEIG